MKDKFLSINVLEKEWSILYIIILDLCFNLLKEETKKQ